MSRPNTTVWGSLTIFGGSDPLLSSTPFGHRIYRICAFLDVTLSTPKRVYLRPTGGPSSAWSIQVLVWDEPAWRLSSTQLCVRALDGAREALVGRARVLAAPSARGPAQCRVNTGQLARLCLEQIKFSKLFRPGLPGF